MVAGGGGNDTISVDRSLGGGPTVVWGGQGADTINYDMSPANGPLGIMVVTIDNLTQANFASFIKDMIDVPTGFDWSEIDTIVLNPGGPDRILINDEAQGTSFGSVEVVNDYFDENYEEQSEVIQTLNYIAAGLSGSGGIADTYQAGFLGSSVVNVFAGAAVFTWEEFEAFVDPEFEAAWVQSNGPRWWDDILSPQTEGEIDYAYDLVPAHSYFAHIGYVLAYPNGWAGGAVGPEHEGHEFGVASIDQIGVFSASEAMGSWFVVGGEFDGLSLVSTGGFTAHIPDPAV